MPATQALPRLQKNVLRIELETGYTDNVDDYNGDDEDGDEVIKDGEDEETQDADTDDEEDENNDG